MTKGEDNSSITVSVPAEHPPLVVPTVTSDVDGTAMKSQPLDVAGTKIHRPGTMIGKALEPLAKGTGEILVLLSLQ